MATSTVTPPLPDGFTLDQPQATGGNPPLPDGFTLDQQEPAEPSMAQQLLRQGGLTARYAVEGAAALPATLSNVAGMSANGYLEIADAIAKKFGHSVPFRFQDSNHTVSQVLDAAGLPQPQGATERVIGDASRALAGAGTGIGAGQVLEQAASPVVQGVGNVFRSQPALQSAGAVSGAGASGITREAGGSPKAQLFAGLIGGVAPSVISSGTQALTRGGFRGGEQGRQNVEQAINDFSSAGTTPTVGQATGGRAQQGVESLLSRTPGGAGPILNKAQTQAQQIQAGLEQQASTLSPAASGEQAGRAITKGISGENGFIDQFKATQGQLYDQLDNYIPKDANVDVTNTRAALDKLNAEIPGAPALSNFFKNAKIGSISGALESDVAATEPASQLDKLVQSMSQHMDLPGAQAGSLPYEAIKKLRTLVGNEISDSWAGSDVSRSKWKTLYGALSSDLEGAAQEAGPEAQSAWSRANNYTRAGMNRIDALSSVIDKNGGPEAVFRAATSGTKEGATTLHAVMQSLPEDAQKSVTATVLRRLGAAKPGLQNELGDKFSTETFLTNWNTLSAEAKRVLFDRFGPEFRSSMDQVAKVANTLREGSQVFRNPSGTGQAVQQATAATSFVAALATGHPGVASGIAAGVGGANLMSRLMTNPNFVKWLAVSTKAPTSAIPVLLNNLAQQGTNDPDLAQAALLLQQQGQQNQPQNNNRRAQGQ